MVDIRNLSLVYTLAGGDKRETFLKYMIFFLGLNNWAFIVDNDLWNKMVWLQLTV